MSGGLDPSEPDQTGGLSNFQQRVLSAIVLIIVVLVLTWLGGIAFRLLAAAIGAAMLHEWLAMTRTAENLVHQKLLAGLLAIVLVLVVLGLPAIYLFAAVLCAAIAGAIHARVTGQGGWHVVGLVYAGLSAVALALLRGSDWEGMRLVLFLFAVVWVTDIMAYFAGKALGGPKLAPSISPGKTWSGALGGAVFAMAAGGVIAVLFDMKTGLVAALLLALILSIVAQAGDLFESAMKRRFAVKDSGHLIPGHGGVMDRVDGLVAAAFALCLYAAAVGELDRPALAFFGG